MATRWPHNVSHENADSEQESSQVIEFMVAGEAGAVIVEKGEDGFYVVECPILQGCFSQGKTIDEALQNIREVIELLLEENVSKAILKAYRPADISLHTITL